MLRLILLFSISLFLACDVGQHSNSASAPVKVQNTSTAEKVLDDHSNESKSSAKDSLVREFISCFNPVDVEKIARKVSYPFDCKHPVSDIENEREFHVRFDEVFDDSLIQMIVRSDPQSDWSGVGDKGIMLLDGRVWLNEEGDLIGVNYNTKLEERKKSRLIQKDRAGIHPSLRYYQEPILVMQTADYQIRIDRIGEDTYRYASWRRGSSMSGKPNLVVENGRLEFQGSGGNHAYVFNKGEYAYSCGIQILGYEDIPGELTITRNGQEILVQTIQELHY